MQPLSLFCCLFYPAELSPEESEDVLFKEVCCFPWWYFKLATYLIPIMCTFSSNVAVEVSVKLFCKNDHCWKFTWWVWCNSYAGLADIFLEKSQNQSCRRGYCGRSASILDQSQWTVSDITWCCWWYVYVLVVWHKIESWAHHQCLMTLTSTKVALLFELYLWFDSWERPSGAKETGNRTATLGSISEGNWAALFRLSLHSETGFWIRHLFMMHTQTILLFRCPSVSSWFSSPLIQFCSVDPLC